MLDRPCANVALKQSCLKVAVSRRLYVKFVRDMSTQSRSRHTQRLVRRIGLPRRILEDGDDRVIVILTDCRIGVSDIRGGLF